MRNDREQFEFRDWIVVSIGLDDERSNGIVHDVLVDDCVAMILVGLNEEQVVLVEFVADGSD